MKKIRWIGQTEVTRERPFLIAEAGVNHEGSLDRAFEMIDAAADAGADMIKFQSYKADTLASRFSPAYWDRSQEPAASQFELFRRLDSFDLEDYRKLADRCVRRGIEFASTPFDETFVDGLAPWMPVFKVASADLTNEPLLRKIAAHGKPVVLSTGASYLDEVEGAVRLLDRAGVPEIALLHCTLEYPTPPEHANLHVIGTLADTFPEVTVGWSDHVPPDAGCHSLLTAWLLGADILEKHYTLDKSLPGNDHYHAMDPDDVRDFVALQRRTARMLGDGRKTVPETEGDARRFARRSLVVTRTLPAGHVIRPEDLAVKRPGTGITPRERDRVIGRRLKQGLEADRILQWEMLEDPERAAAAARPAPADTVKTAPPR